ncbi:MAG: hypothetical protein ABGX16_13870 [Pirellulales bacterium]
MNIANWQIYWRHRSERLALGEIVYAMLVFASMGAITWAIRGTSGWNGIDGTIIPGMTWGLLWWYFCWRKGIDARGIPLWLGLGIALGGELGYGQYVSWIRGSFNVGDQIIPVSAWIGYAWFALCGIGWAAPGGIALGWALAGRKSLGIWLVRLTIPVGVAMLARLAVQLWPWLFFPNWDLGLYVAKLNGIIDPVASATTQRSMMLAWLVSTLVSAGTWFVITQAYWPTWIARILSLCAVGVAMILLLPVAQWLFFPNDQLGLFTGELGNHLGRTVYTNSQNIIVVGWWIGALGVAILERDRFTRFAGLVLGIGFGIGFPLSALWCLGYEVSPNLVDWWKMWELHSGFHLGLLYVIVLIWAIRQVDENRQTVQDDNSSTYWRWCETLSMALGVFLLVTTMAREDFITVGTLLGLMYVAGLLLTMRFAHDGVERRRGISIVYSTFLLIFMLVWGGSSQACLLLGLAEAIAVDQYTWPPTRIALFAPAGIFIVGCAWLKMRQALHDPKFGIPPYTAASILHSRMINLMTFTVVIGATSIWPSKIGVLYAIFISLALFAFNRLNHCFDT